VHILLANDDGYNAPGLLVLAEALKNQHHKITVVAPRENKSGCGMGISLRKSITVEEKAARSFVIDGTPADCVYIALEHLVDEPVDLVLSGINNGQNLSDDILYSGTFAAAMEARRLHLPSIAISIIEREVKHYETAAHIAVQLTNALPHLEYKSLLAVLNVNLPDVPMASLRGLKATVRGERHAPEAPVLEMQSGNKRCYRLGPPGDFDRYKRRNTADFEAVEQGYVSITPLSAKFEDQAFLADVQAWLDLL